MQKKIKKQISHDHAKSVNITKECDFDVIPYFKLLQEKSGIKFSFGRNRTMEDINDL